MHPHVPNALESPIIQSIQFVSAQWDPRAAARLRVPNPAVSEERKVARQRTTPGDYMPSGTRLESWFLFSHSRRKPRGADSRNISPPPDLPVQLVRLPSCDHNYATIVKFRLASRSDPHLP